MVGTAIPVASYTFCLKYLPQQILPTKVLAVLTDVEAEANCFGGAKPPSPNGGTEREQKFGKQEVK